MIPPFGSKNRENHRLSGLLCGILCLLALAAPAFAQENLLEDLVDLQDERLPAIIRTDEPHRAKVVEQVKVDGKTYIFKNEGYEKEDTIYFQTKEIPSLDTGRYLLSMEVAVDSMELSDPDEEKYQPPQGLRIYFYQSGGDAHTWAIITGNGASNGWMKVFVPIDTLKTPELSNGYVMLVLAQAKAKIRVRNFRLESCKDEALCKSRFVFPDGSQINENIHRL